MAKTHKSIEPTQPKNEEHEVPMIGDVLSRSKALLDKNKNAEKSKETPQDPTEIERLTGDADHIENEKKVSNNPDDSEEHEDLATRTINTDIKKEMEANKSNQPPSASPESMQMFAIINWYQKNCSRFEPQHLRQIMEKRGQLAAYSVKYAQVVLKHGKEYARYHVDRQVNVKIRANELQAQIDPTASNGKTYTNARANEIATVENREVYAAEYLAEANYNGHRLILNQINAVLDAMRQDIAELRSVRGDNDKTAGDID